MTKHWLDRREFLARVAKTGAAAAWSGAAGAHLVAGGRADAQEETKPEGAEPAPAEAPPAPATPPPPPGARYAGTATEAGEIPCELCPRGCKIGPGTRGHCQAYTHTKDVGLQSLGYGKVAKLLVEPIEVDHFFHVLPGAPAVFVGTPSCNLHCNYCGEWRISQFPIEKVATEDVEPKALVDQVAAEEGKLLGFTYNDPAVAIEYVLDTAAAAKDAGIHPIAHTNGYLMPGPMKDLASALTALNVDIKAYSDTHYKRVCEGSLQPVLDAIKAARETDVWMEITYLVVPGYNDTASLVTDMCKWVVENCGPATPVHFVRFFPRHQHRQWQTAPTNPATLRQFREAGYEAGLAFVYVGNYPGDTGESTLCPNCHQMLIRRIGTNVSAVNIDGARGVCTNCSLQIPGVWR